MKIFLYTVKLLLGIAPCFASAQTKKLLAPLVKSTLVAGVVFIGITLEVLTQWLHCGYKRNTIFRINGK